ncbi:GAF and ANTAR domain-containing protein [Amycolatopsis solani]|uniref:GAF and ANTAR domain-containing protein n=1 Tax=Amycolatopsis solani TaxID=3028615 RepID=UPI0025B1A984|nr:GAF and ANTAR domain-containing protein [Amycolatopsis sp. MEP2-6]
MTPGNAGPGELPLDREVAAVVARMSGLLLSRETVDSLLELIVVLAVTSTPAAVGAGVTLFGEDGSPATTAASGEAVRSADELQYTLREGPCLAALRDVTPMRIDDTAADRRWPRWSAAAAESGLRSVLSVPLRSGTGCLGAIKVYSGTPGAFGPSDEHALGRLAAGAAALVAQALTNDGAKVLSERFRDALRGRDTIAMARGFLMASQGIDEEAAGERLLSLAQADGRTAAETATAILAAGRGTEASRA